MLYCMLYKINPITEYKSDSPFNLASAKRLRVYLYTQMHNYIDTVHAESIAQLLGRGTTTEDVTDAISFWHTLGVFIPCTTVNNNDNNNVTYACQTNNITNMQEYIQQIGFCRRLTPNELSIIQSWYKENYNIVLVQEAYKRTVANTGKSNLLYMNKMLLNWEHQCIYTLDDLHFVEHNLIHE